MSDKKSRRAVSPVIATVILVAVAITIAVAVSYWMGGISSQYTRFEKVEVTSAYCEYVSDLNPVNGTQWTPSPVPGWKITIDFRNTGTTEASVDGAFVNSKKLEDYDVTPGDDLITAWEVYGDEELFVSWREKLSCVSGEEDSLYIVILDDSDISFTSGTTVEVAIHTGAGNTYMKMVTLS